MDREEIKRDIKFLLDNPDKTLGSVYHGSGKCWLLIDELVIQLRKIKSSLNVENSKKNN